MLTLWMQVMYFEGIQTIEGSLQALTPSCVSVSTRTKAMVEFPRRPTMQEIQARRKSCVTETKLSKRLGMSLPNLGDDQTISFPRNPLLSRITVSDPGEAAEEHQINSGCCKPTGSIVRNISSSVSLLISQH